MMMNMKITASNLDLIMCIHTPLVAFLIRITITSDNLSFTNLIFFKNKIEKLLGTPLIPFRN